MDEMKPIIEMIAGQIRSQIDDGVYKAVQEYGINVDKERLLKALTNARAFWYEGYDAGKRGKPEWINVEERLPEVGQRVLVCCRSRMYKKHVTISTYTADYSYTRGCYWSRRVRHVTHWMPLPDALEVE